MKLNKELRIQNIKEKGYELIGEYINTHEKITIQDDDKYKYYIAYTTIMGNNKSIDKFNKFNPYTIENIHNYININNVPVKLLSIKYVASQEKLLWKCDCGNEFYRLVSNVLFKNQCNCKECDNRRKSETRIHSSDYLKEKIEELGYTLLNDNDYKTYKKVNIVDKDGYKYNINVGHYINNKIHKPLKFSELNPYTLENIRNYIKINNINSELLSNEYKSQKEPLTFTCDTCGQPYNTTPNNYINNKKHQCNNCGQEIKNIKHRHSYEYIKMITEQKGYILLSKEYHNRREYLDIIDSEGYKYSVTFMQIEDSNNLLKFYETNPYTIYNIKNYIISNNVETQLISDKYKCSNDNLLWKCLCGDYFETTWARFYTQHQIRCKKCSKIQSIIENKTENWLKTNNFIYQYQFWFEDCRDKKPLPFDFAIFDSNNNLQYLIECDGRQHYERVKWSELMTDEQIEISYKSTQLHDKMKNTYCKGNKIKLLRIPYWEFKDNNYINILINKLN